MTIPRNLSILADYAGTVNTPVLNLTNVAEVTTVFPTFSTVPSTINYDVITQSILFYTQTNIGSNWTVNLRGSAGTTMDTFLAVGQTVTVALLVQQGVTTAFNNAVQVDGVAVTPKWQGGSPPTSGNAGGNIDAYTYTIIKTAASTYNVLASVTRFA